MARPKFVQLPSQPVERYAPLLAGDAYPKVEEAAARARRLYRGRAIWHVNSTMRGGGVAEMLRSLLPYVRGAGIDTRWVVLRENEEFFALTKRLHNNLHCDRGDGGPLGAAERRLYERTLAAGSEHFSALIRPGDVVFLHDPQSVGLVGAVKASGATAIWRCHIGCDESDETARRAQSFLLPYLAAADALVFSRSEYVWAGLERQRTWIVAPSIDPFSPKNQDLDAATVTAILAAIGIGGRPPADAPGFTRADGTSGRIERRAEVLQDRPLPADARLVLQVSRWDRLKDHLGVLTCFARHLADRDLHLLLAGPSTAAIADDPEGAGVWAEIVAAWRQLPDAIRDRAHLASLPMDDLDENGAMVNALQRRADVVVQKSLAEGFGLTVAEAMWKSRPVVGARVGGIQDQIVDGRSGILVDPRDLERVGAEIAALAADPVRAAELGAGARQRVSERFLGATRLAEYADLLSALERDRG